MAVYRAELASKENINSKKIILQVAEGKGEARKKITKNYPKYAIIDLKRMESHNI